MPQTRTTCPRCKSPVIADVEQLFDLNVDPQSKQRLLNGEVNVLRCPNCGFEGPLSTPVVYHDPDKEFLFTYFPPELGLPANEQERVLGPHLKKIMDRLPVEKRKAYLLRPQSMFTFQTLIEKILEGDGITRQMIEDQQRRMMLIQRLLTTPKADVRLEIIRQEEANIDESFFALFSQFIQASLQQGDERGARVLSAVQQELLENTAVGKRILEQSREAQEAVRQLQEASQAGLTREKLLDLFVESPTDVRINTLATMARGGLDYNFFQMLSTRIESAAGEEKEKLIALREKLLAITSKIDQQMQEQRRASASLLDAILQSADIEKSTTEALEEVDEFFIEILNSELQAARAKGDLERSARLSKVMAVIEKASAPPPEIAFIEKLMEADEAERLKIMEANAAMITPDFIQLLNGLIQQSQANNQPQEVIDQIQEVYKSALRFSMSQQLK